MYSAQYCQAKYRPVHVRPICAAHFTPKPTESLQVGALAEVGNFFIKISSTSWKKAFTFVSTLTPPFFLSFISFFFASRDSVKTLQVFNLTSISLNASVSLMLAGFLVTKDWTLKAAWRTAFSRPTTGAHSVRNFIVSAPHSPSLVYL